MYKIKDYVNKKILTCLYYSLIYPFLIYAIHVWGVASDSNIKPIYILQKRIVRLITGNNIHFDPDRAHLHSTPLFHETGILKIYDIYKLQIAKFVFTCLNYTSPIQILNCFTYVSNIYNTTSSNKKLLRTPMVRTTKYGLNSIKYSGATIWNGIPIEICEGSSNNIFNIKNILSNHTY